MLSNTVASGAEHIQAVMDAGDLLPMVLQLVATTTHHEVRKEALNALSNVTAQCSDEQRRLVAPGVLDVVLTWLQACAGGASGLTESTATQCIAIAIEVIGNVHVPGQPREDLRAIRGIMAREGGVAFVHSFAGPGWDQRVAEAAETALESIEGSNDDELEL